jgi:hypothetical protein
MVCLLDGWFVFWLDGWFVGLLPIMGHVGEELQAQLSAIKRNACHLSNHQTNQPSNYPTIQFISEM